MVHQVFLCRSVPPEFLRSLFSIARAVRHFLKITIVKVYGLLHALSCQISWSPIRSKRYVASVTRCNLHLSLPLKASWMRGWSQTWEETKVNMNKFLLLCLLAGVLHALPSKYLKILPDLIIPVICKKIVSFQILNVIDIFLLFFRCASIS